MSPPLLLIDAFGTGPFTGNPAAVVLLEEPRPDTWRQALAAEMNQAETAFVEREGSDWSLRWFTPRAEVELCGHATLAAAHALWHHHGAPEGTLRFMTLSGVLSAERGRDGEIELDFPALASTPASPPDDLIEGLGIAPMQVCRGPFDLLCVLDDADAVRALAPDLGRLARWPVRGVIATAPADREGIDFVSRFFAPALGVPEDPVTGSAHCALAPYWAAHLGKNVLTGAQLSPRGGQVRCTLRGSRVTLAGRAHTTLIGEVLA